MRDRRGTFGARGKREFVGARRCKNRCGLDTSVCSACYAALRRCSLEVLTGTRRNDHQICVRALGSAAGSKRSAIGCLVSRVSGGATDSFQFQHMTPQSEPPCTAARRADWRLQTKTRQREKHTHTHTHTHTHRIKLHTFCSTSPSKLHHST